MDGRKTQKVKVPKVGSKRFLHSWENVVTKQTVKVRNIFPIIYHSKSAKEKEN